MIQREQPTTVVSRNTCLELLILDKMLSILSARPSFGVYVGTSYDINEKYSYVITLHRETMIYDGSILIERYGVWTNATSK